MSFFSSMNHRGVWFTTLMASAILMITMGTRQSMGLYVGPLNTDTGLGIVTISLAMAIGQFVWGAIQPIAGAFADKYGPRPVLLSGLFILVLGSALTPFVNSSWGLILTMGVLSAMGAGALVVAAGTFYAAADTIDLVVPATMVCTTFKVRVFAIGTLLG